MTKIEEVARAIVAELGRQDFQEFNLGDDLKLPWLDQGEVDFGLVARAAIAAMREPTEAMIKDGGTSQTVNARANRVLYFQRMIDSALSEGDAK